MKINSISNYKIRNNNPTLNKNNKEKQNYAQINELPNTYYPISFSGLSSANRITYKDMKINFTPEAVDILNSAQEIAKMNGSKEIETWHTYLASLIALKNHINELNEGIVEYSDDQRFKMPFAILKDANLEMDALKYPEKRKKVEQVVDSHIESVVANFMEQNANKSKLKLPSLPIKPPVSNALIDDLAELYYPVSAQSGVATFFDSYFVLSASGSHDRKLSKEVDGLFYDLQKALGIKEIKEEKNHLTLYDEHADIIWKNINMGNDVVAIYDVDNKEASAHLVDSFVNLILKPGQKYSNIDSSKLKIIALNDNAPMELFKRLAEDAKKDKTRITVIVADLFGLIRSVGGKVEASMLPVIENANNGNKETTPRIVFMSPYETYLANTQKNTPLRKPLEAYNAMSLPTLNSEQAKKYLTDEKGVRYVEKQVGKKIPKEVILKAIDLTIAEDGNYPEKAIALLKGAVRYNIDEKEITSKLIEDYFKEKRQISTSKVNNDDVNIALTTDTRVNDIVGTPMTKADAVSIVNQIKKGIFKTKGYTIYQSNGTSYGGGRRHVARAIAGEAGIPMITLNAKDFALKDWDVQAQNANFAEMKIKKIVSMAKAQAEANPNKTAMLFIENFDNFGSNSLYGISSAYEQKAFNQLLLEMEAIRKEDKVNLLVIGSVNLPNIIDENILKPYKFLDSVVVYPPMDSQERKEVLQYYINKLDIKLEADDEAQREKILDDISKTTMGFSVVDLIYLLETSKKVIAERNKEKVGTLDFIEAYLQVTTGRPSQYIKEPNDKKIITSHEAGHAINIQIMHELAQKDGTIQKLPDKLNFITLDPRGSYGGAMYHHHSKNGQTNFDTIFSDLVCSYGGYSVEKELYGMDGSWGITADIENISEYATSAVIDMGMGARVGTRNILRNRNGELIATDAKKLAIEQDVDSICSAAKEASDAIISAYRPFIEQFTQRYFHKAGSGDCVIPYDKFVEELNEYRNSLSDEEKAKLSQLEIKLTGLKQRARSKN